MSVLDSFGKCPEREREREGEMGGAEIKKHKEAKRSNEFTRSA